MKKLLLFLWIFALVIALSISTYAQELTVDANTLLLLHFNDDLTGAQGEFPTSSTGVSFEQGIFNTGAYFSTDNQVFFQSFDNIDCMQGTLEFWIKPNWNGDDGNDHYLLRFGYAGGMLIGKDGGNFWRIILNRWSPEGFPEVGNGIFLTNEWTAGTWHHAAFTWDFVNLQVYIDGVLKAESLVLDPLYFIDEPEFQLGSEDINYGYIDAVIDELRISNIVRSGTEIMNSYLAGSSGGQVSFDLNIWLEGSFNGTDMNTALNTAGLIPLAQPFNASPWNYTGTESVNAIPNTDIVDWVLVELRQTTGNAFSATPNKIIQRQAAFLKKNGSIVGLDGSSFITYTESINGNLYVVIWHRNHLAVMSSGPLVNAGGFYTWNFTEQLSNAYLDGQKQIATNVFGMIAGDSDGTGMVHIADIDPAWSSNAGKHGYYAADLNLDCEVNNLDKDNIWEPNYTFESKIPVNLSACGDNLTDKRDGQNYNTVQIGTQCWMADNLNIGNMINGSSNQAANEITDKYCYDNNIANCDTYGGLYQWNEMMQYDTSKYLQGICPEGWHLPTKDEWDTLVSELGGMDVAGDSLKLGGNSGFEALMSGFRNSNGIFAGLNNNSYYWTSDQYNNNAQYYSLSQTNTSIISGFSELNNGYSVRCIKGLALIINSNVNVIDTNIYTLISDSIELTQGIYKYQYSVTKMTQEIAIDDIIIGTTGDGYLRRISSVEYTPPLLTLSTTQATLEDVFDQAEFDIPLIEEISKNGNFYHKQINGYYYELSGYPGCSISLDADLTMDGEAMFKYKKRKSFPVENCKITFNGIIEQQLTFNHNTIGNIPPGKYGLISNLNIENLMLNVKVNKIPIKVKCEIKLALNWDFKTSEGIIYTIQQSSVNPIVCNMHYQDESWGYDYSDSPPEVTNNSPQFLFATNSSCKLSIAPEMEFFIYDVGSFFINCTPYDSVTYKQNLEDDIIAKYKHGMDLYMECKAGVLGSNLDDLCPGVVNPYDELIWQTPYTMTEISGNNQTGQQFSQLQLPLTIKITDNKGNTPLPVTVDFYIIEGSGLLSVNTSSTDQFGYAQTYLTLGETLGSTKVLARCFTADYAEIIGSPVQFTAWTDSYICGQPFTDPRDGQIYNTVQIGYQCWMKENINIGAMINVSQNQTNNEIIEKYCYDNNEVNCEIFGGLYQWGEILDYAAVYDSKGICPEGWHIPSTWGFGSLASFLGGGAIAGGKMKEAGFSHWQYPNTGATNSSGFTALPGGVGYYGINQFSSMTLGGFFWTSSGSTLAYTWSLSYINEAFSGDAGGVSAALSGRCLYNSLVP